MHLIGKKPSSPSRLNPSLPPANIIHVQNSLQQNQQYIQTYHQQPMHPVQSIPVRQVQQNSYGSFFVRNDQQQGS